MSANKLKITQIKSAIGSVPKNRKTLAALGLKKVNQVVIQDDTPVIQGMVRQVKHMIKVESAE